MSSKTNTASELNEILMRLVKEGKVYLRKLEQTMERHKLKKGFGYYPRFLIRFGVRCAKIHGLTEGDFVYIIPQKLFDNLDHKHRNNNDEKEEINEGRDLLKIESMDSVTSKNLMVPKDDSIARVEKIVEAKPDLFNQEIKNSESIRGDSDNTKAQKTVEAKPVIIRAKGKTYEKARIVIDLPKEYIGKKFKLVEI